MLFYQELSAMKRLGSMADCLLLALSSILLISIRQLLTRYAVRMQYSTHHAFCTQSPCTLPAIPFLICCTSLLMCCHGSSISTSLFMMVCCVQIDLPGLPMLGYPICPIAIVSYFCSLSFLLCLSMIAVSLHTQLLADRPPYQFNALVTV